MSAKHRLCPIIQELPMDGRIKWQNEQFIREILRDNRGDDVW
jgi:hypothetical protein